MLSSPTSSVSFSGVDQVFEIPPRDASTRQLFYSSQELFVFRQEAKEEQRLEQIKERFGQDMYERVKRRYEVYKLLKKQHIHGEKDHDEISSNKRRKLNTHVAVAE